MKIVNRRKKFSTDVLDASISKNMGRKEKQREKYLKLVMEALNSLSTDFPFKEAYIFGSITQKYKFNKHSDVDIGFVGLREEDVIKVAARLSLFIGLEVDVVPLGNSRLADKIKGGIRWKKRD